MAPSAPGYAYAGLSSDVRAQTENTTRKVPSGSVVQVTSGRRRSGKTEMDVDDEDDDDE